MKSCIVCDAIIEDNAIFCDACGALQDADRKKENDSDEDSDESTAPETTLEDSDENSAAEETTETKAEDATSPTPAKGTVPSPLDDLIPSPLPTIPSVDQDSMAPPAPIEFASTKPTPAQEGNDTIPEGEGAGSLDDDAVPTPITLEGEGISVDISNTGEGVPVSESDSEDVIKNIMASETVQREQSPVSSISQDTGPVPLPIGSAETQSTRPVLVAVLMGLFFLCLATWFVSNENRTYEASMANSGSGAEEKHNTLALGEATLVVTGSANATVRLNGQALGKVPFTGKITPGTHALAVGQEGFETQKKNFTVKKGEKYELAVSLIEVAKGMAWVPQGPFFRGCDPDKDAFCQRYRSEQPGRRINLDGFYIDKTEVTVADYRRCVAAGKCIPKGLSNYTGPVNRQGVPSYVYSEMCNWNQKGRDKHPLNCVTWYEGEQYCQWQGKHLPTEAQWEKAARGTTASLYPWGNADPSCHFAVIKVGSNACSQKQTWNVGAKPEGQSPFGVMDMVGNVSEWVWDRFSAGYYAQAPSKNPTGPGAGFKRGIRGGAWSSVHTSGELRASYRWRRPPTFRSPAIGFRCAKPGVGGAPIIVEPADLPVESQVPVKPATPVKLKGAQGAATTAP